MPFSPMVMSIWLIVLTLVVLWLTWRVMKLEAWATSTAAWLGAFYNDLMRRVNCLLKNSPECSKATPSDPPWPPPPPPTWPEEPGGGG